MNRGGRLAEALSFCAQHRYEKDNSTRSSACAVVGALAPAPDTFECMRTQRAMKMARRLADTNNIYLFLQHRIGLVCLCL